MALNYFHLPNSTVFHGVAGNPKGYSFKQARQLTSDIHKINHLKQRLETYYIHGMMGIKHPFISAIITCVGIEVLGQVMVGVNSDGETINANTIAIYQMLDPILNQPLSTKFKNNYNHGRKYPSASPDCTTDLHTYAHVLRKGLRNSFTHGYRTLGVVFDSGLVKAININERLGMLIIDAEKYNFEFCKLFEDMFDQVLKGTNAVWRINALKYFDLVVK